MNTIVKVAPLSRRLLVRIADRAEKNDHYSEFFKRQAPILNYAVMDKASAYGFASLSYAIERHLWCCFANHRGIGNLIYDHTASQDLAQRTNLDWYRGYISGTVSAAECISIFLSHLPKLEDICNVVTLTTRHTAMLYFSLNTGVIEIENELVS